PPTTNSAPRRCGRVRPWPPREWLRAAPARVAAGFLPPCRVRFRSGETSLPAHRRRRHAGARARGARAVRWSWQGSLVIVVTTVAVLRGGGGEVLSGRVSGTCFWLALPVFSELPCARKCPRHPARHE